MAATGRRFKVGPNIEVRLNNAEFVELRKQPALEAIFVAMGEEWVGRLNTELHAAQKARGQPIADGYKYSHHSRRKPYPHVHSCVHRPRRRAREETLRPS